MLDDSVFDGPDGHLFACCPQVKKKKDQERLWKGLKDGEVSVVSTDTCTFTRAQKARWEGDWTKIPMGLPGLETLLPIVYTHGVLEGRLTPSEFVAKCCTNPAKIMGLYPRKGVIAAGSDADLAIIDPEKRIEVDHRDDGDQRRLEPLPGLVAGRLRRDHVLPRPEDRRRTTSSSARAAGAAGCRASGPARSHERWPSAAMSMSRFESMIASHRPLERLARRQESPMFRAGERQSLEDLSARFADMPPPLSVDEARVEAARCLFCFDAPCTRACPTHIDVPRFIRQILHRDELGAARTILDANIFGGSCARACPTEVLCEGACVDRMLMKAPVQIGRLQRHRLRHRRGPGRPRSSSRARRRASGWPWSARARPG